MLDIGDVYRLQAQFFDSNGTAADPTTITLIVSSAGGSTTYTYGAAEITKDSTGVYYKDLTIDVAGAWEYRWTSTGTPTTSEEGAFSVNARIVA